MTWISFILPIRCVFSRFGNRASVSGKLSGCWVSQVKGRVMCKLWQPEYALIRGGEEFLLEVYASLLPACPRISHLALSFWQGEDLLRFRAVKLAETVLHSYWTLSTPRVPLLQLGFPLSWSQSGPRLPRERHSTTWLQLGLSQDSLPLPGGLDSQALRQKAEAISFLAARCTYERETLPFPHPLPKTPTRPWP